ncbi:unnamed protein product [Medioppia subpectinata]|uniref:Uncharacterized protein n=1 Tax=Medioppia subpectinata TaxID=1979941 RepID=A0A7R9KGL5_9ACAR|nr:unnamed protein product [Medioppia subpectinata]CAG2102202.1 unnamed protein product [Medioppia subpectinata]
MSSQIQTQPQTQTRSQVRCLSPVFQSPKDESNRKQLKTERNSDCKTRDETKNGCKDESKEGESADADGPARRLRPRRSTPKPVTPSPNKRFSPFTAMMNRLKTLNNGSEVKRKLLFNKQKVYPSTFNSEEPLPCTRVHPPRSPSCSVCEDIFVSPFVPKISTKELESDTVYGANYLSLKIVFREDMEVNDQKLMKLIATDANIDDVCQASTSKSNGIVVNEPKIVIYLYGSYVNCRAEKNKVINIVKFKTQSKVNDSEEPVGGDFEFAIVVQSSTEDKWVPFVSITNTWKAPEDPKELNKTLFQTPPPDKPRPELFSSNTSKK